MNNKQVVMAMMLTGMGSILLSGCTGQDEKASRAAVATYEAEQSEMDQEKITEEQQNQGMAEGEVQSLETFENKVEEEEESPSVKEEENADQKK